MRGEGSVSVVLPTFNERETIGAVVREVRSALSQRDHEVIVVDDDSPDRTWQLVREEFRTDEVSVIRRRDKTGLSSAVLDGFKAARNRFLVCMDADGQHPAERLPELVDEATDGIAVGSRHSEGGKIDGWPLSRKLISATASRVSHIGIPSSRALSDPMSGFFALDGAAIDGDLFTRADPHGYKILLELLVHSDLDVSEVPITFDCRRAGESKLTVDEQVRFLEHTADLGLEDRAIDINAPLAVRSVELGLAMGGTILLLLTGIIVGGLDGAVGAGLIGGAGALWMLATMRWLGTADTWEGSEA